MILAILSDIHSNPWALEAVIHDARQHFGDQVRFCILGDLIGYGPFPLETIRLLQTLEQEGALFRGNPQDHALLIPGNHEGAWMWLESLPNSVNALVKIMQIASIDDRRARLNELIGKLYNRHLHSNTNIVLNEAPFEALVLNVLAMGKEPETKDWYQGFFGSIIKAEHITEDCGLNGWSLHLAHGKLTQPLTGELRAFDTDDILDYIHHTCMPNARERSIFLHGHTHVPMSFASDSNKENDIIYGERQPLDERLHLINPGGVGMQRDYDTRPAYAVLEIHADGGWVTFFRVNFSEENIKKREKLLHTLVTDQYPEKVVKFFRYAPFFSNGNIVDVPQHLKDYLTVLKKRAGDHWIDPEGVPQ